MKKKKEERKKCKKKTKKKTKKRDVWYQFISFILYHFRIFMCFLFSLKCQNSVSDLIQCYCAECVCLSAYECLQKYVVYILLHTFLKWLVFPSLTKLCKSNSKICNQIKIIWKIIPTWHMSVRISFPFWYLTRCPTGSEKVVHLVYYVITSDTGKWNQFSMALERHHIKTSHLRGGIIYS